MFNYKNFKELRKKKKLSIDQIAVGINSTKGTVYSYQSGSTKPSEEVVQKIAAFLEVDYVDLWTESEDDYSGMAQSTIKKQEKEINFLKEELATWKTHANFLKDLIREQNNMGKLRVDRLTTGGKIIALPIDETKQSA